MMIMKEKGQAIRRWKGKWIFQVNHRMDFSALMRNVVLARIAKWSLHIQRPGTNKKGSRSPSGPASALPYQTRDKSWTASWTMARQFIFLWNPKVQC